MGNSLNLVRRFDTKEETIRNGGGPNADLFGPHLGVLSVKRWFQVLRGMVAADLHPHVVIVRDGGVRRQFCFDKIVVLLE